MKKHHRITLTPEDRERFRRSSSIEKSQTRAYRQGGEIRSRVEPVLRQAGSDRGRFHRIEISIERPGAKVAYRRGYRVPSDEERTLDTIIANLNEPRADLLPRRPKSSLNAACHPEERSLSSVILRSAATKDLLRKVRRAPEQIPRFARDDRKGELSVARPSDRPRVVRRPWRANISVF